jgi:hypothetical protein
MPNFKVFDVMKRPRTTVRFTSDYARDSVRLGPHTYLMA